MSDADDLMYSHYRTFVTTSFSNITSEGALDPEWIQQWTADTQRVHYDRAGNERTVEIGSCLMVTVAGLDDGLALQLDDESADLIDCAHEVFALPEIVQDALIGPSGRWLLLDNVTVKPEYRGQGLAVVVASQAIEALRPFCDFVATYATQHSEFRQQVLRLVERLDLVKVGENVWARSFVYNDARSARAALEEVLLDP
jgi:GNAT superfamily N-acetyltransferase